MLGSFAKKKDSKKIATVIGFYLFVSMGMVMLNKVIMLPSFFPFPTLMTWLQLIIQLVCVVFVAKASKSNPMFAFMPPLEFNLSTARKVLPVSMLYVSMILANNFCLHHVEISFYQVARSLTILFTIIFTYLLSKSLPSKNCMIACSFIVIGYILSATTEINVSVSGIVFGLSSSVFVSLYGISVKTVIEELNDNHWRLLQYNSILSVVFMIPFVLFSGEASTLSTFDVSSNVLSLFFVNLFGGIMGFLLNIAIFLQIKYTSPLTNNIIGTAKATALTILALLTFRNPVTFMNLLGCCIVIGGSGVYSYFRMHPTPKK